MTVGTVEHTRVRVLDTWEFRRADGTGGRVVRLPHDAMLAEQRSASSPGGADTAWFPGGRYEYRTTWTPRAEDRGRPVGLRFEGVQGDAAVTVNGTPVGTVRSGYFEFEFPIEHMLRWDAENEIAVDVDHEDQPGSRWYPGSGLYRPVSVVVHAATRFAPDGVRLHTRSVDGGTAEAEVSFEVVGEHLEGAEVYIGLVDAGEVVACGTSRAAVGAIPLSVANARLWSAESPHLYDLVARIEQDGKVLEVRTERVGLRTVAVDARRGLQINGRAVKLRGACIHHDNGILGAGTHRAAELRRVRILKESGFNALRSAHNPMSRELLDACDELGMYVLDEFADHWFAAKTAHDRADRFRETWREDAARLIGKDRNRACVVMYAIGNEIPETATPEGVALSREIADHFRRADPHRPVTLAVNLFLNTLVSLNASPYKSRSSGSDETSMAGSTEANVMVNQIGRMMHVVSRLPRADRASRDAFATVDVAGYNYGLARYERDVRHYPDRVILGTETLPGDVPRAWELVRRHPAVIGDFVWTGWEYLGEAGVAVWVPGKRAGLSKPYPYIIAGPGMHDLTGRPDVSLRLAQAAWGTLESPAIAVRPLDRAGTPVVRSAWRITDAVESWAWRGCRGRLAEIEVYSADDEIELLLNGHSLGRRRTGGRRGHLARFKTRYEPGTLTAIGYRGGRPVSKSTLRSAAEELALRLSAERSELTADGFDLAFVTVEVADRDGVVEMLADEPVALAVTGPAELIGFGSAAPATEESYLSDRHTTFRGRALAVLRSTGGTGTVTLTARARSAGSARLELQAITAPEPHDAAAPAVSGAAEVEVEAEAGAGR
ncbi:glycoside hydrolase family 2 TIM barrel-domain containing protein [Actinocorallia populi]|uniref:glycoside hydrolase family 2 TIM barrel-domain containing protein n=1 Tax=Actinocorallia populi TaxID=2079200 RepID=UPI000D08F6EA|nr:glycoside hydrolase family 2 TIM barrel-domain containing protein [Actinocorallia populi]